MADFYDWARGTDDQPYQEFADEQPRRRRKRKFTEEQLKAHDAEVAAAAWDEGYETGHHEGVLGTWDDACTGNPYRSDEVDR